MANFHPAPAQSDIGTEKIEKRAGIDDIVMRTIMTRDIGTTGIAIIGISLRQMIGGNSLETLSQMFVKAHPSALDPALAHRLNAPG